MIQPVHDSESDNESSHLHLNLILLVWKFVVTFCCCDLTLNTGAGHHHHQLAAGRAARGHPSGPYFSFFVLGLPHVTLIELRLALISYQDYHMLLLTLAGRPAGRRYYSAIPTGHTG